ncbi:histone H3.2-like [Hibiscus syriacus]|uniref:Histone H3.2-like n=1 Tax=Hibiscus syriacus TaxID=106335 RepID=A0A6A2WC03_HIBSY|nr:histone H3.2-like [Hibiscus syriacus]
MAAASQIFQNKESDNNEVGRQEIQAAVDKAVKLRALHGALTLSKRNNPANKKCPSFSSPLSRPASQFSAQDYPVFTPGSIFAFFNNDFLEFKLYVKWHFDRVMKMNRYLKSGMNMAWKQAMALQLFYQITRKRFQLRGKDSPRQWLPSNRMSFPLKIETPSLVLVQTTLPSYKHLRGLNFTSPVGEHHDFDYGDATTDSHLCVQPRPKNRGVISWLFPKLKKKHKNVNSPTQTESEDVSQIFKEFGMLSIEKLKRELMEANENRDAALMEIAGMRSSLGDLKQKIEYLETYCVQLKRALRQKTQSNDSQINEKLGKGISIGGNGENPMPVSEEVMVKGFLQIVSEASLSVKQFCKTLVAHIQQSDSTLTDNLNLLLQPYKLSLNSKYSSAVSYHLESIIIQSFFQDFEGSVFRKSGSPKLLDPQQNCQTQFSSFVALRNLGWNEVLRKGSKYYGEEFSKFCDEKMSLIISTLNWTIPCPEQLLQAFFVAAKRICLLRLLAFSFNPRLGILRIEENRDFDPHYMEDMFMGRQK